MGGRYESEGRRKGRNKKKRKEKTRKTAKSEKRKKIDIGKLFSTLAPAHLLVCTIVSMFSRYTRRKAKRTSRKRHAKTEN